jgi:hypothetical protein
MSSSMSLSVAESSPVKQFEDVFSDCSTDKAFDSVAQVTRVLHGDFLGFENLKSWFPLRSKLLVFVSSTFTDTHRERNVLMETILPDIRARGAEHGIDVTLVDMRWGVIDENTLDHATWDECVRELNRCFEESGGLFFLSLQADKYGYRPLPRTIDQAALDITKKTMSERGLSYANYWYRLDTNACPPRYVLRNLTDIRDQDYWDTVLPVLRRELSHVIFDSERFSQLRVGLSVTHWEALNGLHKLEKEGFTDHNRFIWAHRQFAGGVSLADDPSKHFMRNNLLCLAVPYHSCLRTDYL